MLSLQDIRNHSDLQFLVAAAGEHLRRLGYTEHGLRHVDFVSSKTKLILERLGHDPRTCELGAIAGFLHDVGNMHNRKFHGPTGAGIVYAELRRLDMPLDEICQVTSAIANHEEETGVAVSPISAALIIADKSDAHRTRVGRHHPEDIHDRVNLAITASSLDIDPATRTIALVIDFDTSLCQVMDYFEIYLRRMEMCKEASELLNCRFRLVINDLELLGHLPELKKSS